MKNTLHAFVIVLLSLVATAHANAQTSSTAVLKSGTYKQVQGNCCSIVNVYASTKNSLVVSANENCGNLLTTFDCNDGVCTWDHEIVAVRTSTAFELISSYEDGTAMTCKFQRK